MDSIIICKHAHSHPGLFFGHTRGIMNSQCGLMVGNTPNFCKISFPSQRVACDTHKPKRCGEALNETCRDEKITAANKGEISVRVIRTAHENHEMGIPCVAVYSTIDHDALNVKFVDESVCISEGLRNQPLAAENAGYVDIRKERGVNFIRRNMISLREGKNFNDLEFTALISEMRSDNLPGGATLSTLMLCYAENGLFPQAQALWCEMMNSSLLPSLEVVSDLMYAYAKMGQFGEVTRILHEIASRGLSISPKIYSLAVSCFGKFGKLELMEDTIREMVSRGFKVDSATGNAFVVYYSIFGSLTDMETAYERLKKSRILIEETAIRAMSNAYINQRKFYKMGEFLRDVGLGRRNSGNLLWNLLLLSYAANFKMKSMQREFLRMVDAGFSPDITTFNIRSLAFSRMCMFWDLHLSLEHMRHEGVAPDLVTYGCIVDAYLNRRLGRNLSFVLNRMSVDRSPLLLTDPLVFEVFGKGDFHSSSEALLESSKRRWTYSKLVAFYLRKQYRSNQIFWNY